MNYRALALGATVGFLIALMPSCGGTKCSAANCNDGCCDSAGQCVKYTAQNNTTCGTSGQTCSACTSPQTCNTTVGRCEGGAGGGGGGGGGGGTISGCGPGTTDPCTTGCCSKHGAGGVCFLGAQPSNCGSGGAVCQTCVTGQACINQQCQSADAGSGLGGPCTTAGECTISGASTLPTVCKTQTSFGNLAYPGGYCTRRCFSDNDCGGGECVFYMGEFGEGQNICLQRCGGGVTCRTGYECINLGTSSQPNPVCWIARPTLADGGAGYEFVDAGTPPDAGVIGGPCAQDTECQPPEDGYCYPEIYQNNPTGYYGGACQALCTYGAGFFGGTNLCGPNGACIFYRVSNVDTAGFCERLCSADGGQGDCRDNYVCDPFPSAPAEGTCQPNCNNDGGSCGSGSTCSAAGICQ